MMSFGRFSTRGPRRPALSLIALCLISVSLAGCRPGAAGPAPDEDVISVPPSPTPLASLATAEAAVTLVPTPTLEGAGLPYKDPAQPVAARVKDLLARM